MTLFGSVIVDGVKRCSIRRYPTTWRPVHGTSSRISVGPQMQMCMPATDCSGVTCALQDPLCPSEARFPSVRSISHLIHPSLCVQEKQLQDEARRLWSSGGRQQQQQDGAPAAAAVAAAPAAQQNGQPPPSAAADAAGAGNGTAASAAAAAAAIRSPVSCLVLPAALQQRVTKELKIHKHQVGFVGFEVRFWGMC